MNLTPTGMSLLRISYMLQEARFSPAKPLILMTDSQNAKPAVTSFINHARIRHIDVGYEWIIDLTQKGPFEVL